MKFLNIKVYRRKFILYFCVLFLLCFLLCWMIFRNVMDSRIESFKSQAQSAFQTYENDARRSVEEINEYVKNMYSDPMMLQDFQFFFGKTSEGYQTERLKASEGGELVSFVDDIRTFAAKGNRQIFSYISFHPLSPDESINVISFSEDTSPIRTLVSHNDPIFNSNIQNNLIYVRKLVLPTDLSEPYGEIRFAIRSDWLFSDIQHELFENVVVFDENDLTYIVQGSLGQAKGIYKNVINSEKSSNVFTGQQIEYHSSNLINNIKMIITTSTWSLITTNNLVAFIIIGTLMLFLCTMFLIALNLRTEARFLNRIIKTIDYAKRGEFKSIDTRAYKSRNEYGLIATELNEMSLQLEEYIRTEYILKLKQKETEMIALQNQINPHFLYNTLEIIRSMAVMKQTEEVADAIAKLGKMYRDIVKSEPIISLEQEVELLKNYLAIMDFKNNGNLYYQVNLDYELRQLDTVKFWLQPLAENYFKHGFDKDEDFNLIIVDGRDEETYYVIQITDNGKQIEEAKLKEINENIMKTNEIGMENIGLKNVYNRLKNFYGERFSMEVANNEGPGISIIVRIRKKPEEV